MPKVQMPGYKPFGREMKIPQNKPKRGRIVGRNTEPAGVELRLIVVGASDRPREGGVANREMRIVSSS